MTPMVGLKSDIGVGLVSGVMSVLSIVSGVVFEGSSACMSDERELSG